MGILEHHIAAIGITPALPTDRLAVAITGLLNGLGIEELSSAGAVPDDLFGEGVAQLLFAQAQI